MISLTSEISKEVEVRAGLGTLLYSLQGWRVSRQGADRQTFLSALQWDGDLQSEKNKVFKTWSHGVMHSDPTVGETSECV